MHTHRWDRLVEKNVGFVHPVTREGEREGDGGFLGPLALPPEGVWSLLFGVELVLQLHKFAWSLDLVGDLLALGEEPLALLKGQALWRSARVSVLLLLTTGMKPINHHQWANKLEITHNAKSQKRGGGQRERQREKKRQDAPFRPFLPRVFVELSRSYNSCWVSSVWVKSCNRATVRRDS